MNPSQTCCAGAILLERQVFSPKLAVIPGGSYQSNCAAEDLLRRFVRLGATVSASAASSFRDEISLTAGSLLCACAFALCACALGLCVCALALFLRRLAEQALLYSLAYLSPSRLQIAGNP